jgi:hypothetical protein
MAENQLSLTAGVQNASAMPAVGFINGTVNKSDRKYSSSIVSRKHNGRTLSIARMHRYIRHGLRNLGVITAAATPVGF